MADISQEAVRRVCENLERHCYYGDARLHNFRRHRPENAEAASMLRSLAQQLTEMRAENERLNASLKWQLHWRAEVEKQRDQTLALLAAAQMEMRERAAQAAFNCDWEAQGAQGLALEISTLPIDPDAEAALQRALNAEWDKEGLER